MVRGMGLEPTCRKTLEPKSSASANFATRANCTCIAEKNILNLS